MYEQGEDYIDSFWPLFVTVLNDDGSSMSIEKIKTKIAERYDYDIPILSLSTIATRAKRKDYIIQNNKLFTLTKQGIDYKKIIEKDKDVTNRIDDLVNKASLYLKSKCTLQFTDKEIKELLLTFIKTHIRYFEQYISPNPNASKDEVELTLLQEYEAILIEFIIEIEKNDPDSFITLQNIIMGSIISLVVNSSSFQEFNRGFDLIHVFLDTNILFGILGMDHDEFNKSAQELYDLMLRDGNFHFSVFDFTVKEMMGVLSNYYKEIGTYPRDVKVNSIFSSLRAKNWTPGDVRLFMAKIEDTLSKRKISIYPTKMNMANYSPVQEELRNELLNIKQNQPPIAQNHDLAAIEVVARLRGKTIRKIEEAKVIFLTSDNRLARYNYFTMKHAEQASIAEVIPDRILANILWLKKSPTKSEIPLESIIAFHAKGLFIDEDVWKRFITTVSNLRNSGTIDERDMTILIYDQQITRTLKTKGQIVISAINNEWILNNLEQARKRIDSQKEVELKILEKSFDTKLNKIEQEKEGKKIAEMAGRKDKIKIQAEKDSTKICTIMMLFTIAILLYIGISIIPFITRKWVDVEMWSQMVFFALAAIGICRTFIFGKKDESLQRIPPVKKMIFNWLYKRNLALIEWEEN